MKIAVLYPIAAADASETNDQDTLMKTFVRAAATTLALFGATTSFAGTIDLDVTIRDFQASHPDFEQGIGGFFTGMVESTLGVDGTPTLVSGAPLVNSAASFYQWYHDVPGVNLSTTKTLTLTETSPGIYTYSNNSFFPIDGELFGNYAFGHNYHFTLEMNTSFTYQAGQTFSFTGDDDLWVFINKQLVIDLGGVHGPLSQSVNLDTLGLTAGQNYTLDLFFAERQTTGSNFSIQTSITTLQTVPVPEPTALLLLGSGLIGLGRLRRRRAA